MDKQREELIYIVAIRKEFKGSLKNIFLKIIHTKQGEDATDTQTVTVSERE